MTVRFVISADPAAIAAAGAALTEHGVDVEHVANDATGLRHLDVTETTDDEPASFTRLGRMFAAWRRDIESTPFPTFHTGRFA